MYQRFPYPLSHLTTAYATDELPDGAYLGQKFTVNPTKVLAATAMTSGGAKEHYEAGDFSGFGEWIVMYYKALNTITTGLFVQMGFLAVVSDAAGSTTTFVDATSVPTLISSAANLWRGANITKTEDAGATNTEEGKTSRITASTVAGTITFTPAWAEANASGDTAALWHPGFGMLAGADTGAMGLALSSLTVGQYGWMLCRGVYPKCQLEAAPASAGVATAFTTGTNGKADALVEDAEQPVVAKAMFTIDANYSAVTAPLWIDCINPYVYYKNTS